MMMMILRFVVNAFHHFPVNALSFFYTRKTQKGNERDGRTNEKNRTRQSICKINSQEHDEMKKVVFDETKTIVVLSFSLGEGG